MASTSYGTVKLTASARFGYGGKQFIARITGRHPRFTFEYEFLGKKGGKRGEDTSVTVDEPGLYIERDIDSKGRNTDTIYAVFTDPSGGVDYITVSSDDAMKLAKLPTEEIDAEGRRRKADRLAEINDEAATKDPAEEIEAKLTHGDVEEGKRYPRSVIMAARAKKIAALRGETEAKPASTSPARAEIEARVADLERQLDIARAQLAALPTD